MLELQRAGLGAAREAAMTIWTTAAGLQAAGVTIALRTPILLQAALDPFAGPAREEAAAAAAEKWLAAIQGGLAAVSASAAAWRSVMASPGDPLVLARGLRRIAYAASRPARIRARGNARRLSGPD